jgi:hypothetical protein
MATASLVLKLALAAITLALSANLVSGAGARCEGTQAVLEAVPPPEVARVCEAAISAESELAHCSLAPSKPYTIRFVPDIRDDYGSCIFGRFRSNPDVASILGRSAMEQLVASIPEEEPMSVLRSLPLDDLHRSLIVHEVTHAIVHQNLKVPASHAIHEYIAAVIQLGTLSRHSRDAYLARFASEDVFTDAMFNDLVEAMNPARFAAAAYRHFHQPGNGCIFVRRLLNDPGTVPRVP